MNSLPKTVTRQRRDCDLNPGPTAPESSTLTTRLPSNPACLGTGYCAAQRFTFKPCAHYIVLLMIPAAVAEKISK